MPFQELPYVAAGPYLSGRGEISKQEKFLSPSSSSLQPLLQPTNQPTILPFLFFLSNVCVRVGENLISGALSSPVLFSLPACPPVRLFPLSSACLPPPPRVRLPLQVMGEGGERNEKRGRGREGGGKRRVEETYNERTKEEGRPPPSLSWTLPPLRGLFLIPPSLSLAHSEGPPPTQRGGRYNPRMGGEVNVVDGTGGDRCWVIIESPVRLSSSSSTTSSTSS